MKKLFLFLTSAICLFVIHAHAGPVYDKLTKGLPKDVVDIIDRRIHCNYLLGEMPANPNDPEVQISGRPQMLEKQIKERKCSALDQDEKKIRAQYKKKKDILEALDNSAELTPAE